LSWLVTVCASESWFVQVTLVPTLTVSAAGAKAKPLMVTAFPATGAALAAAELPDVAPEGGMEAMSDGIALDGDALEGDELDDVAPGAAAAGFAGLEHAASATTPASRSADAQSERRRRGRVVFRSSVAMASAGFALALAFVLVLVLALVLVLVLGVSLFEVT